MKTGILLLPILFLSTVTAWGKEPPPKPPQDDHEHPAESRRHDYKQSLKKPFLHNGTLPFWDHHGNTFVATDFIRLAPSVPGLQGSVWRSSPNKYKDWEVEFAFRVHGPSHVGGRGMAFWYTEERAVSGPVFGSMDKWTGLGFFMDTSDLATKRIPPIMYGMMNDGTKDIPKVPVAGGIGACIRDYKNSPVPAVIRVSYIDQTLKVSADTHYKGHKMTTCFERKDVVLPTGYYFGMSATTSATGVPDDHDLYSFEVYEVNPPPKSQKILRPHEAEMIKKGGEVTIDEEDKKIFENVQKIVEEQEAIDREEIDGPSTLTAAQVAATVADTQQRIVESLETIHNKLEALGAPMQPQESTAKSLGEINQKVASMAASLRAMENVVQGLVEHIKSNSGDGVDITKVLKDELHTLNNKMEQMDSRQSYQHQVTQTRLVSSRSWMTYVVFLIILQAAAVMVYSWYKKRLEMSHKKFI
ncbi:hypothetical protein BGZ98_003288 [Dissophora globulifera]|nr:hypothetical protein BGZ98_003288 [Dissophora globulifera]